MAGKTGINLARDHESARREHVVLRPGYRQSCAAHEYYLGYARFGYAGASGQAVAQCETVNRDRRRRREAGPGHEFVHAASGRRQNRGCSTVAVPARARGLIRKLARVRRYRSFATREKRWPQTDELANPACGASILFAPARR